VVARPTSVSQSAALTLTIVDAAGASSTSALSVRSLQNPTISAVATQQCTAGYACLPITVNVAQGLAPLVITGTCAFLPSSLNS
jgi:hypothetical protein